MDSSLGFRLLLRRQVRFRMVHVISLLVSVLLADLPCCNCLRGSSYRSSGTFLRPVFHRHVYVDDHVLFYIGDEDAGNGLPLSSRHEHRTARRATGVQSVEVSVPSNSTTAPPDMEVDALVAFKAAIMSDPTNALRSWTVGTSGAVQNGSDACSAWFGVICSPQFPNHVTALNLSKLGLVGRLDSALPTLGQLPFLQSLDLSVNNFNGSLQRMPLTNLSHLSYLNVSRNLVTGGIPSEIGELSNLQYLDLRNNSLTGTIPGSLGNCSLLRVLQFGQNSLDGVIPASLGRLARLTDLVLSFNSLSGSIPGAIGNCSSLRLLNLNYNYHIGGQLPEEMSQLKQLQQFVAEQVYDISGTLPHWVGNLTSLTKLSMYENNLVGEIPDTLWQLQHLQTLSLAVNQMSGEIPLSVYNLSSLDLLQIAGTHLSGQISPQVEKLSTLRVLNLAQNQLTGVIPSSLANCTRLNVLSLGINPLMDPQPFPWWTATLTGLTTLYLSFLNLEGHLQDFDVGKLYNLEVLAVAYTALTGTIPVGIQNCSLLSEFDVSSNSFSGSIPAELGVLRYVTIFYAGLAGFTGPFPGFIGNWTYLMRLDTNDNFFSGPLDVRFDRLEYLLVVHIGEDNLDGPIPESLGNCTSLTELVLAGNRFSGPIPGSLGNLPNLQRLNLATNKLQGPIPINILESDLQLVYLDLSQNQLEGSLPSEIGRLVNLTQLILGDNKFTGEVPESLGNCSNLGFVDLSRNQFEGSIPGPVLLKMSAALAALNLSQNHFSGVWPPELGQLRALQFLNVSSNNISGSIPLGLGSCVNLELLDVSMNNLTGEIPQDLGSLKHLESFNASFNDFTGSIPQSGIFSNSSRINASSFLGNPGLCGPVAIIGLQHLACSAAPENVTSQHHQRHCKGFNCKHVWIPVTVVGTLIVISAVWITVGVRLGWMFSRRRGKDDDTQTLLNFGANLTFTQKDVLQTINNPSADNVIGRGGRSVVYLGIVPGGQKFALKKLLPSRDFQADNDDDSSFASTEYSELIKEAEILAQLRHKNILKYLGFYSDVDHKALMVEYMSGGCLHKQLHEVQPSNLRWKTRFQIALGVAQGMKYLHHDLSAPVIHRDLKPSNIFLDADSFEPKVGDFGISKCVGPRGDGEVTASTMCGTAGYMPPEYGNEMRVSTKGDVYSYGMLIIELLTGRQPCSTEDLDDQGSDLRNWVLHNFTERPLELLDPILVEECSRDDVVKEQVVYLLRVSLFCTRADPQSRPSMINVIGMLAYIKNLGEEPVNRKTIEELANEVDPSVWVSEDPALEGSNFGSN